MVLDPKNTCIAYRCPHCGNGVVSMVGVFALSGDMMRLKCECGESELTIETKKDGMVNLSVPCMICPRPHNYSVAKDVFFENEIFAFGCTYTGFDVCFVGDKDSVLSHLEEQGEMLRGLLLDTGEENLDKLRSDNDPYADFDDPHIDETIRFMIADLGEEGNIHCGCKEGDVARYTYEFVAPDYENVEIKCLSCSYAKEIPMASSSHADAFLEYDKLDLLPPQ